MNIVLRGEECQLLPEGGLHWLNEKTVFVADTHFGKVETFRTQGIPVPGGATRATLQRLTRILDATCAKRLIVLGDFWHAKTGTTSNVIEELTCWRQQHAELQLEIVRGNHDRFHFEIPSCWELIVHNTPVSVGPFLAAHYPTPREEGYVLAGHLHPGHELRGRARQSIILPCFWFGHSVGVLPAFGGFTGLALVTPQPGDRVFITVDGEVAEVSYG